MRFVCVIVVGAIALLPCALSAQQVPAKNAEPELSLAITYNAQRGIVTSSGNGFWTQGGGAELMATFYHGLGIAADVTGTHASNISPSGVDLTMVTATFGPTYTWGLPRHGKSQREWKIFGESLLGVANGLDSVFPNAAGAQSSSNSLALQVGGGADLDLSRHIAVRVLQADWLRTELPNAASNVQNNLQLGAGIVFQLPK